MTEIESKLAKIMHEVDALLDSEWCKVLKPVLHKRLSLMFNEALAAHDSARVQPASVVDGWVMVPRDPTDAMCNINPNMVHPRIMAAIYKVMLTAAPQAPAKENE